MKSAPEHPKEEDRLSALLRYEILDTEDEKAFDELTQLASEICGTSISLVSLIDAQRQWFKSRVGLDATQTDRSIAFCSHAILQDDVFEVEDASLDERFHDNPLVTGAPDIRFYAGAPLVTPDGYPLGTLCVIDQQPLKLSDFQKRALKTLSNQIVSQLETRLHAHKLERINRDREKFYAILAHDLKSPFNGILNLSRLIADHSGMLSKEKISEISTELLNASVTAYQVLDEILQWSQSRLENSVVELSPVSVKEVIDAALEISKDNIKYKNVTINDQIDETVQVLADNVLLKAVMRNLISNAVKYTPTDSSVTLNAERYEGHVLVSVMDEGPGIGVDKMEKLFVSAVKSQEGSIGELGHGLGLALCGEFVLRQKGEIWVDTHYQAGTKIIFKLGAL